MGKLAVFPRVNKARARRWATSSPSAPVSNVTRLLGKLAAAALLVALIAAAGCGGPKAPTLVSVTGKVQMNGQPLTAGSVIFYPEAANEYKDDKPSSLLQLDGSFTMKTYPFGDGVPLGKYKVTLAPELAKRVGKPQYADPKQTPWQIDVPAAGLTDQLFDVK